MRLTPTDLQQVFYKLPEYKYNLSDTLAFFGYSAYNFMEGLERFPQAKIVWDRIRGTQAEMLRDELIKIADNVTEDPARSKLKLSIRQWLMEKTLPDTYGNKSTVEQNVSIDIRAALEEGQRRVINAEYKREGIEYTESPQVSKETTQFVLDNLVGEIEEE